MAMNISTPISLGHIENGLEISIAPEVMQDHLSLLALVNGVVAEFKSFHSKGLRLAQYAFDEGTNQLLVVAMLKPGANSQQTVIEFKDLANDSIDRFIVAPTHDQPDTIEVLIEA